jgi:hypothetical protein
MPLLQIDVSDALAAELDTVFADMLTRHAAAQRTTSEALRAASVRFASTGKPPPGYIVTHTARTSRLQATERPTVPTRRATFVALLTLAARDAKRDAVYAAMCKASAPRGRPRK